MIDLPSQGAACPELRRQTQNWWMDAASRAGLDLSGFDPEAPLDQRLAWACQAGLSVATVYTRYSSKGQHSTADQVRAIVTYAGQHGLYVAPEFINVDEAVKGRCARREGLSRLKLLLKSRQATVLLVFKVSRLFRQAFLGYQLIQEEVVEEGLRAISVSQGIDTADEKTWKAQLQLHGLLDDLLLDAIADHCREGLYGLFFQGFVVGALTIGYKPVEVPGAPPTKRGGSRTKPAIDEPVAALIRQHFEMARDGVPLSEGLRRWRAAGGPCDPRSTTRTMTSSAYRRLLTNERYTGRWEYGRKKNSWSSKKDYTRQVVQPDGAVKVRQCEELRIVSDELFLAVQQRLRGQLTGSRGPRDSKAPRLCDLVTGVFHCPHCQRRFYTAGSNAQAMRCSGFDCPTPAIIRRDEAVAALCHRLTDLLTRDQDLVARIVAATQRLDARSAEEVDREAAELDRKVRSLSNRIVDLSDLAGEGSDDDRAELKARIRAAQAERAGYQLERTRLQQAASNRPAATEADIRAVLAELGMLLEDGASGRLGSDAVYKAAEVFCRLVGGKVWVVVERRPGRKRAMVRGRFTPQLLRTVAEVSKVSGVATDPPPPEVEVCLRQPPRLDVIAAEVRRLYEEEGFGFRAIGMHLGIKPGNVYQSYLRYYEMQDLPAPPRRPRGRHRRPT